MKIFTRKTEKTNKNNQFLDIDHLLDSGYTEIPKSKIDSVIKDLGYEYPYIAYSTKRCDVVGVDDFDCDTIIFAFEDKDNNGIYLNEELKLFFTYRNTISINDIRSKISTLVK